MARDRRLSRITYHPSGSTPQSGSRSTTQTHPTGEATESTTKRALALSSKRPQRKKTEPRQGYYGPPKCPVGTMFESRMECSKAEVHNPPVAGISYSTNDTKKDANPGAYSIVVNGGYEDDIDAGYTIYYTGAGGQTNSFGEAGGSQVEDQSFQQPSNHALRLNLTSRNPVRVVRGFKNSSVWAPREGYRYDGLYQVNRWKIIKGKSGHKICMFKLTRMPDQKPLEDLPRYFMSPKSSV